MIHFALSTDTPKPCNQYRSLRHSCSLGCHCCRRQLAPRKLRVPDTRAHSAHLGVLKKLILLTIVVNPCSRSLFALAIHKPSSKLCHPGWENTANIETDSNFPRSNVAIYTICQTITRAGKRQYTAYQEIVYMLICNASPEGGDNATHYCVDRRHIKQLPFAHDALYVGETSCLIA